MKIKALAIAIAFSVIGSLSVKAQGTKGIYRDYKKNDKGQPTEVVTYKGDNDENLRPMKKTTYVYDEDNVILKIVYAWDGMSNKWVEKSKINYSYVGDKYLLSTTQQLWDERHSEWSKSKEYMLYQTDSVAILLTQE